MGESKTWLPMLDAIRTWFQGVALGESLICN